MNVKQLEEMNNLFEKEFTIREQELKRKGNSFVIQNAVETIQLIIQLNNIIGKCQGVELINELKYYLYYVNKECNEMLDEASEGTIAYVATVHKLYFISEIAKIMDSSL